MINAETLGQFKPGATLLNVSRGALVDSQVGVRAHLNDHSDRSFRQVCEEHAAIKQRERALHTPRRHTASHGSSRQSHVARATCYPPARARSVLTAVVAGLARRRS